MIHRTQRVSFRTSEFPLSGGFLQSLLKPRYLNINIGDLFEYLADQLKNVVGALKSPIDFTLVNVCSPFTKFSHGYYNEPPTFALPNGKAIVFTFLTRAEKHTEQIIRRRWVRSPSNSVRRWGFDGHAGDFVSISLDMTQGDEYGCAHPGPNELQYIYNLIGAMTKSFARRQGSYLPIERSYQDFHSLLSLRDMYSEYYRMPLKQLFQQAPYHLWVFNYHVWEYAPNLLPQRTITPAAAMYYFMYLNGVVPLMSRRPNDVTMKRLGYTGTKIADDGIAGILSSSVLRMVQMMKTPGDIQLTDDEILAPAVINAFLTTGKPQLSRTREYMGDAIDGMKKLITDVQSRENELGYLFLPPDETARKIMRTDIIWRDRIRSAMLYPQDEITRPIE